MAQTGYTPISTYYSATASSVPLAANLVAGELALNTNDGKLYYKNSSNVVTLLASSAGASGDVVGPASSTDNALARFDLATGKLIQNSVGLLSDAGILTGLTGVTSSGPVTLSSLTSTRLTFAGVGGLLSDSANLTWDGSYLSAASIKDAALTSGRITFAGASGLLSDASTLTWDGSYLTAASIKDTALTSGRVTYAGTAGLLQDSANLTFNGTTLTANTIGAFTLGGTIAGGGNQLNNVIIGTSSPLAGAFTTLSASGTITASNATALTVPNGYQTLYRTTNDTSSLLHLQFFRGTGAGAFAGIYTTGDAANGVASLNLNINGTDIAKASSTGLAVTGALSTTGQISSSALAAINLSNATYSQILSASTMYIDTTANNINIRPSGSVIGQFSSTGIAVSGNIDLIAANTFPTTGMFLRAADNQLKICAGSAGIAFAAASGASTLATLDASGNLGLGVTPSAWSGYGVPVLEMPSGGTFVTSGNGVNIGCNWYYTGGNFIYKTSSTASYYQQGSGAHQWFTAPSGTAGTAITFTQAMTLDSSGNLLVGTTSGGSYKLDVVGTGQFSGTSADTRILMTATGVANTVIGFNNSGSTNFAGAPTGTAYLSCAQAYPLVFGTSGTERARIDSSGNLLVGTTTAAGYKLRVYDGFSQFTQATSSSDCADFWNRATTGDNKFVTFYTEGTATARGSITYNRAGGLVVYNTTSDYRAKDISGPVTNSGTLIDSVPVYMGTMKGATQERPMFIAHETPSYAHTGEKDAVDADGNPVYQQMDASALIPVMWAEIQSLRKRITALEAK